MAIKALIFEQKIYIYFNKIQHLNHSFNYQNLTFNSNIFKSQEINTQTPIIIVKSQACLIIQSLIGLNKYLRLQRFDAVQSIFRRLRLIFIYNNTKTSMNTIQHDMICFNQSCIQKGEQLFNYTDLLAQFHINQNHQYLLIDGRNPCFRDLKQIKIEIIQPIQAILQRITMQYNQLKQKWDAFFQSQFAQTEQQVRQLYKFNHKKIEFSLYKDHLQRKTSNAAFYMQILNQYHTHKQQGIEQYIRDLPSQNWKKKCTMMNNAFQSLKKEPIFTSDQLKIGQKVKQSYMLNKLERNDEKYMHKIEKRSCQRNPAQLVLVGLELIKAERKMCYKAINPELKQFFALQRHHKTFQRYFNSVANSTFNQIQMQLIYKFPNKGILKISNIHKEKVYKQFKQYKTWMDQKERQIFEKCIKFFNDIDKTIEIGPHEIYVIYARIMIKIIQINNQKQISLNYNAEPFHLRKEIIFIKVEEILKKRYIYSDTVRTSLSSQIIRAITSSYINLVNEKKLKESKMILKKIGQYSFEGRQIEGILLFIAQYGIKDSLSEQDYQKFEALNNQFIEIKPEDVIQRSQLQAFFKPSANLREEIELSDDDNLLQERMARKSRLISDTKVVKLEYEDEDARSNHFDLIGEQIDSQC